MTSFSGIVPPMVTPLLDRDTLDVSGVERLIDYAVAGGIHGIFLLGTCGESAGLSGKVRREVIDVACRRIAGRIPVLVGVTDTSVAESLHLARYAAAAGAAAVVISAPYYLPLEQRELAAYASTLAAEQPLPVLLYNMPGLTKTAFAPETVEQLSQMPQIVGIKDSSGEPAYLQGLQRRIRREDWCYFSGNESLMAVAVMNGASGGVPVGALVAPRVFVDLFDAARRGDRQQLDRLQEKLQILDRIYSISPGVPSIIRGVKCALGIMGICSERMAEPYRSCDAREREIVRELLGQLRSGA